jgi:hypothetical protein
MKLAVIAFFLLFFGLTNSSLTQTSAPDSGNQKRTLIEQKIRLIDMLINSPAAKTAAASRDQESARLIEAGQKTFETAKQAYAEDRLDDASKLLDEALKSASSASKKMTSKGDGLSESAQRKTFSDMADQIATYRASVADLTRDPKVGAEATQLLLKIDGLTSESRSLADSGRLSDANKKLASTYKLTIEEISRLRAGQEVLMSLKFDTPADEYAYELKRFSSTATLVDMMIAEGRAEGQKRNFVDGLVTEGNKLKSNAQNAATAQQHKEAVALMEKAVGQLNKALQSMGIPVF